MIDLLLLLVSSYVVGEGCWSKIVTGFERALLQVKDMKPS